MTNWLEFVANRIRQNLLHLQEPLREQVVAEEIEKFTAEPVPEEKKPEPEEPMVRGEKLSSLRLRARKFGGWEPWTNA